MRTRIAFLLVVPVFIVLTILAAMSGPCGGGGGCVATVRVGDDRYSASIARGLTIRESDVKPYALATRVDAGPIGDYLLLVSFTDATAWDLACPYFETARPGRSPGCP